LRQSTFVTRYPKPLLVRRHKRKEIYNPIPAYRSGDADQVGADTARTELQAADRSNIYVGKDLVGSIRVGPVAV